jgi:hypothetical protein
MPPAWREETTVPNALARLILFLSAYAPLLALFAILDSFHRVWAAWTCGAIASASLLALRLFWVVASRVAEESFPVEAVARRDEDVVTFFVTYVVPFAVAPIDSDRVALALLFFLGLVGLLYLRGGVFRVHPVLLACGWHLYEVDTGDPTFGTLSCYSRLDALERGMLSGKPLAPAIYVVRSTH